MEVKKIEMEIRKARMEEKMLEIDLEQKAEEKEAFWILSSLIRRFETNPINLVDIELATERKDDKKENMV